MKVRGLLFAVFFFCATACFSLGEDSVFRRHELGFNATLLFKQFLNFNSSNIPFSPYQFTYKYLTKKNINFRLGAGVASSKTIETQLNMDPQTTKNYFMNYRLGLEKQSVINKHWKCYYGLDVTYDYMDSKSDFGSTGIRDRSNGFGFGPMLGLQFYINRRISLYTEMTMLYKDISSRTEINNRFNSQQNQDVSSNEVSMNIFLPTTLFLAIKL
jgi:hypothetical protein